MDFSFNINLEWLSSLSCALSLWEKPKVKEKIRLFFIEIKTSNPNPAVEDRKWAALTREVIDEINPLCLLINLPQHLISALQRKIIIIGKNIHNWINYVTTSLQFDITAADVIYWTPYGTVDQSKIFQLVWSKDVNLFASNALSWMEVGCVTGNLHLLQDQSNAIKYILNGYKVHDFYDCKKYRNYHLLTCALKHLNINRPNNSYFRKNWPHPSKSAEVNFFFFCISEACPSGVKHYWDKMSVPEQEEFILLGIVNSSYLKSSCGVEVLGFLLSKASREVLDVIFNDRIVVKIFDKFSTTWPWQQFSIKVLKIIFLNMDKSRLKDILMPLSIKIKNDCKLGYNCNTSLYCGYFKIILHKIPEEMRKEFISLNCIPQMFYNLLSGCDLENAKMIYAWEICPERKFELIDCAEVFENWVSNGKLDLLEKFMSDVLVSNAERQVFKAEILNFYGKLIILGSLNPAVKLMKRQNVSEEEIKIKVNASRVCEKFVEREDYIYVEKFLVWYFNTPEKITAFKKEFGTKIFLRNQISKFWKDENKFGLARGREFINNAEKKSLKLLNYFLNPEELSDFKNYLSEESKLCEEILFLICQENYSKDMRLLEGFMKFCTNGSEEKMNKIKQLFKDELDDRMSSMVDRRFDLVESFITLISKDENEKLDIIRNYMDNRRGAELCKSFFRWPFSEERFINFLNVWVKPCKNIAEIKNGWKIRIDEALENNESMYKYLLNDSWFIPKVLDCFEKLEVGKYVEFRDITRS